MVRLVSLLVDRVRDLGIAVPDADGDDAAKEVEVFVPVDVPDVLVFSVVDDEQLVSK
ncbi:MAG: hypothetical protein R2724_24395 [Bryobacterales bacterium]